MIILLAVGVAVQAKRHPQPVPFGKCSELYQRYADTEGIAATFVHGYRLNDSVRIDVTLLQATDSAAWYCIRDSLLAGYSQEAVEIALRHSGMWVKQAPKGSLGQPPATGERGNDFIVADLDNRAIAIFHSKDEEQLLSIMRYYYVKRNISKTLKS